MINSSIANYEDSESVSPKTQNSYVDLFEIINEEIEDILETYGYSLTSYIRNVVNVFST